MYIYQNLVDAYRSVGLSKGDTIVLKTNLLGLGPYNNKNKQQTLKDHLTAVDEVIDLAVGTLVVATSSTNLCNTNKPFSIDSTPSIVGALTEYIRELPESVRTYHAFESYTAIGSRAEEFCANLSRFSYGLNTPEDRLVQFGAKCVCLGVEPRLGTASIHHVEAMAHVPYRYIKEYKHPVVMQSGIKEDTFYRHVWYRDCGIKRSGNELFFKALDSAGLEIKRHTVGTGQINAFSLEDFFSKGVKIMQHSPFIWLKETPTHFPWNQ